MANVLLVDDDKDQLELRGFILESEGYRVQTASSPAEALLKWTCGGADTIVMDLRLPGPGDGLELIRRLRATGRPARIVVLSGWPADLSRAAEASLVDHVLQKPVPSERLLELLRPPVSH